MSTSMVSKDQLEFDPSLSEDERKFYKRAYLDINVVRNRKVHCTVCKMHIGTAPSNESIIRMHPILRVTHCKKCHEFYNSGEFSKGEDGSELYCRWCGQGGEVYCCSNCPYVFCKSCIISNLSRGVVADIEQNENWSCFNCSPKMLWPLRAQHWALIKFIDKQKKAILNSNLSDAEIKTQMMKDRSTCCKIKKNSGYGSDSSNSSDISLSRLKQKAGEKRSRKSASKEDLSRSATASPALSKKAKTNDEVVCTPDVMSMLEPECQLTVPANAKANPQPPASSPKIMSIPQPQKLITPPPSLVVRNIPSPQVRPQAPAAIIKKTIVGPRMPASPAGDFSTPVYHTINGFRIDLNSAAQQETVRLPNGKLIQVKRQGSGPQTVTTVQSAPNHSTPTRIIHNTSLPSASPITPIIPAVSNQQIVHSSGGHIIRTQLQSPRSITVQNAGMMPQFQQHQQPQPQHQAPQQYQQITIRQPNQQIATIRYQGAPIQQGTNILQNGTVQLVNGTPVATNAGGQVAAVRQMPQFLKQFFPNTPLGLSRTQLQNQIFSAMEICQHLMGKVQTLTNSNAYKTAKSLTDVKELYIHLSYLLSYAIGRFKGLQDNCLTDMRDLGFTTDANSLENGQLAAGMDMVRSGKIKDFVNVDLDSFHDLIVRNMDLMNTAAVDSSAKDGKIDMRVEDDGKLRQYDYGEDMLPKYDDNDNEKLKTGMESDYCENAPSPEVQIIEDDDDECLLVETSKNSPKYKSDDEVSNSGSDDEDNLLVQIGERTSDCEWDTEDHATKRRPPITQISDDEDEEVAQRFSTSYEIDGDYSSSSKSKSSSEIDAKVIELVKKYPELWDPDTRKTNPNELHRLWKKISKKMPRSTNCRCRWRNIKYRYLKYLQRLEENESGEHIPPPANADLLKFLDKIYSKPNTTANTTTTNVTLESSTKSPLITAGDHEFLVALINAIKKYPSIWHPDSAALKRHTAQPEVWLDIYNDLKEWGHKQASDAEEDEISIVEPKTDTINLDSDNDDDPPPPAPKTLANPQQTVVAPRINTNAVINPVINNVNTLSNINTMNNINAINNLNNINNINNMNNINNINNMNNMNNLNTINNINAMHTSIPACIQNPIATPSTTMNAQDELSAEFDYSSVTNILAGMLEVELTEGNSNSIQLPKKPRKKTTNKPNPTLLKQKEMQERERLENIKKNDAKLKMQVQIPLNKVEEIYQYAKPLVDELKHEKHELLPVKEAREEEKPLKEMVKLDKKEETKEATEEKKEKEIIIVKASSSITTPSEECSKSDKADVNSSKEPKTDDKEESDEVVVVLVDMDNSKEDEEAKNVADDEGSVELIEHDEAQDSDRESVSSEKAKNESAIENPEKMSKEDGEEKLEQDKQQEEVTEVIKEGAEVFNHEDGDDGEKGETEILIDFENSTSEIIKPAKDTDSNNEKPEAMSVDVDPLEDASAADDLLVPLETQDIDDDVEKDLLEEENIDEDAAEDAENSDSSISTPNLDTQKVLSRTEVA